ncbi:hypothetical protein GOBAR_AA36912 [Gossypium barbadense]|uniref:Uncharacterized protein n=1 Tax=Gossypium barbadense TaxID=3634 RepID=A0A2P5VY90_GOSBA|nr:hypothetical protein GOBAR_AA36912 [Gossypium barbadense]
MLKDVVLQLGLPVDEVAVTGSSAINVSDLCQELLGRLIGELLMLNKSSCGVTPGIFRYKAFRMNRPTWIPFTARKSAEKAIVIRQSSTTIEFNSGRVGWIGFLRWSTAKAITWH